MFPFFKRIIKVNGGLFMDILSMVKQLQDNNVLDQLSKQTGASKSDVSNILEMGVPALLQAMSQNAKQPEGAKALEKALTDHENDSMNDVVGFLKNVNPQEGNKILQHIFGSKTSNVEKKIASSTNVSDTLVDSVLKNVAPMVLTALGQQKKKDDLSASNLSNALGMFTSMISSSSKKDVTKIVTSLLDADNDGDVLDDVSNMIGGLFKKR